MSGTLSRRKFIAGSVAGISLTTVKNDVRANSAQQKMPLRPLGETGEMVSLLAFGGGSRYATICEDEAEAERIIHRAIELGINYFDNAYSYGNEQLSQKRYGWYLCPNYRSQIFLTNKSIQRKADDYMREFDESLENLKTDRVDLMYFHGVDEMKDLDTITGKGGALEVARRLVDQKVVRFIGMSGHRSADVFIEAIDRIGLNVVMFPCNAAREQELLKRVMPYAHQKKVAVMAMKTTAQDKLIGKGGATAPELVRYAMGLPVCGTVIGIPSMEVLESCAEIARTFSPMSDSEKEALEKKVAAAAYDGSLYYLKAGYRDGVMV